MTRKTKEKAQETREAILLAATEIFFDKGVQSTTLDDIAKAAGVTRGAIYWHFKNKTDIFSALHQDMHTGFLDLLTSRRDVPSDTPLEQLADLSVEVLHDLKKNDRLAKLLAIFLLKCDYASEMAAQLEAQQEKIAEALTVMQSFFDKALANKQIPADSDTKILALAYYTYTCGIMTEAMRYPGLFDLETQARPLVDLFFKRVA